MNTHASQLLTSVLEQTSHHRSGIAFVVVAWPQGVWKTAMIDALVQQSLWAFIHQDYFALRDMSRELWKDHTIRVQQSKADATIKREDGTVYENKWARDLVEWLYYAPAWTHKVALIERIERMNTTGLNALLKSFEEPLNGRLIIATTSDDTQLIDTIRSRAMIVHVWLLNDDLITSTIQSEFPDRTDDEITMIIDYAQWRIGVARELACDDARRWSIADVYKQLRKAYATNDLIKAFGAMKQWLKEVWSLQSLISLTQRLCSDEPTWILMKRCVEAKRIAQANVNDESIAFRVSLAFHQWAHNDHAS